MRLTLAYLRFLLSLLCCLRSDLSGFGSKSFNLTIGLFRFAIHHSCNVWEVRLKQIRFNLLIFQAFLSLNFTLDICLNFLFALGELILDPIKTLYRNTSSSLAYMDCRHWPYLFFSFSFPSLLFSKSNPLGFWNYVNRSTQDEKVRGFLPHKL